MTTTFVTGGNAGLGQLDVLVNNAGVSGPRVPAEGLDGLLVSAWPCGVVQVRGVVARSLERVVDLNLNDMSHKTR